MGLQCVDRRSGDRSRADQPTRAHCHYHWLQVGAVAARLFREIAKQIDRVVAGYSSCPTSCCMSLTEENTLSRSQCLLYYRSPIISGILGSG
jgi:hypothetical protein